MTHRRMTKTLEDALVTGIAMGLPGISVAVGNDQVRSDPAQSAAVI